MPVPHDLWYIRFPDGRVLRAKSTEAVRYQFEKGRIPIESRVRRSEEDEWLALDWTAEFADLVEQRRGPEAPATPAPAPASADKLPQNDLKPVGVRPLVDELLNALDGTLQSAKLKVAAVTGLAFSLVFLAREALFGAEAHALPLPYFLAGGGVCLLLAALGIALITQMVVVELSRLRPARRVEVTARLLLHTFRILAAYALIGGILGLGGLLSARLPAWLPASPDTSPNLGEWADSLSLFFQISWLVLAFPVLGMALLIAPIIVVEECSVLASLGQWWQMLRKDGGRVLLYETLAAAIGVVICFPLVFPVLLAGWFLGADEGLLGLVTRAAQLVLGGIALTPFIAYLIVANVFIYLNLRYDVSFSAPRR